MISLKKSGIPEQTETVTLNLFVMLEDADHIEMWAILENECDECI